MQIIIDSREKYLTEMFEKNNIPFKMEMLSLGDIIITNENIQIVDNQTILNNKLLGIDNSKLIKEDLNQTKEENKEENIKEKIKIVIERKTYTDLKSSMTDGRYKEQKSRLKTLQHGTCYYILENNDKDYKSLAKNTLFGMFVHTTIRDGIPVFMSNSLEETYEIILKIKETMEKYSMEWKVENIGEKKDININIKKKKPTGENVYKLQLCCFSGISAGKADLIIEKYPNIISLIDAVKNETFKVKGIGTVLINNLKEGLML